MPNVSEVGFVATTSPITAFPFLNSYSDSRAASWGFTIEQFCSRGVHNCHVQDTPSAGSLTEGRGWLHTKGVSYLRPPSALPGAAAPPSHAATLA